MRPEDLSETRRHQGSSTGPGQRAGGVAMLAPEGSSPALCRQGASEELLQLIPTPQQLRTGAHVTDLGCPLG